MEVTLRQGIALISQKAARRIQGQCGFVFREREEKRKKSARFQGWGYSHLWSEQQRPNHPLFLKEKMTGWAKFLH